MRKGLTAALVLCLAAGRVLSALGWRNAAKAASAWEARSDLLAAGYPEENLPAEID